MIRTDENQICITLDLSDSNQTKQQKDSLRSAVNKAMSKSYPNNRVFVCYQTGCKCGDQIDCQDELRKNIRLIIESTKKQNYQQTKGKK